MSQVMQKEATSMAEVEIGTIFYASWGYDQTNIEFYKVIRKTATMVELRAIGQIYVESDSSMSEYVMPDPENELFKSDYMSRAEAQEKGYKIIREQEGSESVCAEYPEISKHKVNFSYGQASVKFASYKYASIFDGRPKLQSHWA